MPAGRRRLAVALALLAIIAAGCGSGSADSPAAPRLTGAAADTNGTAYDAALSEPREDSLYPDVGDPGVDALHYQLDLTWAPDAGRLTATETLLLRATTSSDHLRLDLARQIMVGHVWLDGRAVSFQHSGKDLVVLAPVRAEAGTSSN